MEIHQLDSVEAERWPRGAVMDFYDGGAVLMLEIYDD